MIEDFAQDWPAPSAPKPIVLIGAGGIVRDAHLPAYAKAGLKAAAVAGVGSKLASVTLQQCREAADAVLETASAAEARAAALGVLG